MPKLISLDTHQTIVDMMFLLDYERYNYKSARKAGYQFTDLDVERTGIMLLVHGIKQIELEESEYEKLKRERDLAWQ